MANGVPFFSVVIPAYNTERWIGQTLESFAGQTTGAMEVIVVDDCSRDATVVVAEAFAGRLDLKIIREPRSGAICEVDLLESMVTNRRRDCGHGRKWSSELYVPAGIRLRSIR